MKWNIDPTHSQAEFSVRHMFTKVRGHIVVASGVVDVDESDPTKAVIVARLDPSTVNTGVPVRDDHLRSLDFFDIQRYPEIVFHSTAVSQTATDHYAVVGMLSMHGIDRPVTLDGSAGTIRLAGGPRSGCARRAATGSIRSAIAGQVSARGPR